MVDSFTVANRTVAAYELAFWTEGLWQLITFCALCFRWLEAVEFCTLCCNYFFSFVWFLVFFYHEHLVSMGYIR